MHFLKYKNKYNAINNKFLKGEDEMALKQLVFLNVLKMGKAKQRVRFIMFIKYCNIYYRFCFRLCCITL